MEKQYHTIHAGLTEILKISRQLISEESVSEDTLKKLHKIESIADYSESLMLKHDPELHDILEKELFCFCEK